MYIKQILFDHANKILGIEIFSNDYMFALPSDFLGVLDFKFDLNVTLFSYSVYYLVLCDY